MIITCFEVKRDYRFSVMVCTACFCRTMTRVCFLNFASSVKTANFVEKLKNGIYRLQSEFTVYSKSEHDIVASIFYKLFTYMLIFNK